MGLYTPGWSTHSRDTTRTSNVAPLPSSSTMCSDFSPFLSLSVCSVFAVTKVCRCRFWSYTPVRSSTTSSLHDHIMAASGSSISLYIFFIVLFLN